MLGAYAGLYILVNYYDVEARCLFFTKANFLKKMTNTLQTAQSASQHFVCRISNSLFLCNKHFDQKLPDVLELAVF